MKIFLDSATNEIKTYIDTGFVDGVTSNPSLIAKSGRNFPRRFRNLLARRQPGQRRVAATLRDDDCRRAQARKACQQVTVNAIDRRRVAHRTLSDGNRRECHPLFLRRPGLLAAKAGTTIISPFVGRLDDIGQDGMGLIEEIVTIYDQYGFEPRFLWHRSAAPACCRCRHDGRGCRHPAARDPRRTLQASAERQGPCRLHFRLGRHRTVDPLDAWAAAAIA